VAHLGHAEATAAPLGDWCRVEAGDRSLRQRAGLPARPYIRAEEDHHAVLYRVEFIGRDATLAEWLRKS
jgi:hypothetical protein